MVTLLSKFLATPLVHSDGITACPFSIKKCAKMSVFYVKTVKIRWRLGISPPDPRLWIPFAKSWMRHRHYIVALELARVGRTKDQRVLFSTAHL